MRLSNHTWKSLVMLIMIAGIISGCVNTRKAIYFNDASDGTITANTPIPESIIQKNDLLSISVSSLNSEATDLFNMPNVSTQVVGGINTPTGYLVNAAGTIQFPMLGDIKVTGMTKEQLRNDITKRLTDKKLLKDPIISIRFLNFRVTVLGEVKNPTVINVPNEKISLLEAIGLAGDLTIYAKRENILVIREENGNKVIKRLNLNNNDLLSSPYYYLRSNDIVYAEPNKARVASAGSGQQWIPAVLSGLSLIVIIADRLLNN